MGPFYNIKNNIKKFNPKESIINCDTFWPKISRLIAIQLFFWHFFWNQHQKLPLKNFPVTHDFENFRVLIFHRYILILLVRFSIRWSLSRARGRTCYLMYFSNKKNIMSNFLNLEGQTDGHTKTRSDVHKVNLANISNPNRFIEKWEN